MRIFPEPITDAEHIERVRRTLAKAPWFRAFHLTMGLVWLGLAIFFIQQFWQILANIAGQAQQNPVFALFFSSVALGLVAGQIVWQSIHIVVGSNILSRSDRMVVELWDILHSDSPENSGCQLEQE